jgi:hypothetical protein
VKRETISWENDKRQIKEEWALVSLETQITRIYDKEDVNLINEKTWANLRVLQQKKRKNCANAKTKDPMEK